MELKSFIKETLVQVAHGIIEANEELKDTDAHVNPNSVQAYSNEAKAYGRINKDFKESLPLVELIEFDVAVQADSGTKTGGGIKISIASIGIGSEGSSEKSTAHDSRIKFSIPMVYPHSNIL